MTTQPSDVGTLIKATRAAAEAFLAVLDGVSPTSSPASNSSPMPATTDGPLKYDPLNDEPPFVPNPAKSATDAEQRMAWIVYLGSIGRLNADEGRGATSKEVSEFARKAGYSGGNAVNGWNSRATSPRAVELIDGARFLNDHALEWMRKDSAKLGIELVGEFATVVRPE